MNRKLGEITYSKKLGSVDLGVLRLRTMKVTHESIEWYHCKECCWNGQVRNPGGGFLPFDRYYVPEMGILFSICDFWRMSLKENAKPEDHPMLRWVADGIIVSFDGSHCPRCGTAFADKMPEHFGDRCGLVHSLESG